MKKSLEKILFCEKETARKIVLRFSVFPYKESYEGKLCITHFGGMIRVVCLEGNINIFAGSVFVNRKQMQFDIMDIPTKDLIAYMIIK